MVISFSFAGALDAVMVISLHVNKELSSATARNEPFLSFFFLFFFCKAA